MTSQGPFHREILGPEECLALLGAASLARVLISVRCLPAALPAFVQLERHRAVIASSEDAVVEAARRNDVLAVQVDGSDDDGSTWSVQVTGTSRLADEAAASRETRTGRILEALEGGAILVDIPLTVVHGERIRWSFPR